MKIVGIDKDTARMSFSSPSWVTQWEVTPREEGWNAKSTVRVTTNPYDIGGLSSSNTWDFQLAAICENNVKSTVVTFPGNYGSITMPCNSKTAPWTDDFSKYGSIWDLFENCWSTTAANNYLYNWSTAFYNGDSKHPYANSLVYKRSNATVENITMPAVNISTLSGKAAFTCDVSFTKTGTAVDINNLPATMVLTVRASADNFFSSADTVLHITRDDFKSLYNDGKGGKLNYQLPESVQGKKNVRLSISALNSENTYSLYVDNLRIRTYSECYVDNLAVKSKNKETMILSWDTIGVSKNGFEYVIQETTLDQFNPDQLTPVSLNWPYSFPDIPVETDNTYCIAMRQKCTGSTYGDWTKMQFTAPNYVDLPYKNNFEGDINDEIKFVEKTSSSNRWRIGDAVNNTPNGSQAMYVTGNGVDAMMYGGRHTFSIAYVDVLFGDNDQYLIQFDWKASPSWDNAFGVGIGEPSEDLFSWDEVGLPTGDVLPSYMSGTPPSIKLNVTGNPQYIKSGWNYDYSQNPPIISILNLLSSDGWYGYSQGGFGVKWRTSQIVLDNEFNGGVKRLYFVWKNGTTVTDVPAQIDNLVIRAITCPKVNIVQTDVKDVTHQGATLSWTSDNTVYTPQGYEIGVMDTKGDSWQYFTVADTFAILNTLNPGTNYKAIVRSKCPGTDNTGVWSDTIKFQTPCGPFAVPYSEKFEVVANNATLNQEYYACWEYMNGYFDSPIKSTSTVWTDTWTYSSYTLEDYSTNPATFIDKWNMVFGAFTGAAKWLVTPDFHIGKDKNKYMLKTRLNYAANYAGAIDTLLQPNTINDTFAIILSYDNGKTWDINNAIVYDNKRDGNARVLRDLSHEFQNVYIPFNIPEGSSDTTVRIAYYVSSHGYSSNYITIKEVSVVDYNDCFPPLGLTCGTVTSSTANVAWTKGKESDNSFNLLYKVETDKDWKSVIVTDATSYQFKNLVPGAKYIVRVLTNCGSPYDTSRVISIITKCDFNTFPWIDGLENGRYCYDNTSSGHQSDWKLVQGGSHTGMSWFKAATGPNVADNKIVGPTFDLTGLERPIIDFWLNQPKGGYGTQTTDKTTLYYRVSPDSSWVKWQEITETITSWKQFRYLIPVKARVSTFQFAFEATTDMGGGGIGLDDITIFDAPAGTCSNPTGGDISELTQTSAKLTWTSEEEYAGGFKVKLNADGVVKELTSNAYVFRDLKANTSYVAFIQTNCGVVGESEWVSVPFTTLENVLQEVVTLDAKEVKFNEAKLTSSVKKGTLDILKSGFMYKQTSASLWIETGGVAADEQVECHLIGLKEYTSYEYKAFAMTSDDTIYGEVKTFKTPKEVYIPASFVLNDATSITHNSASLSATITNGDYEITSKGIEYKEETASTYIVLTATDLSMSFDLTNLKPNTKYVYRAYANTDVVPYYSDIKNFTTLEYLDPIVVTDSATIDIISAKLYGTFTKGTDDITERGFSYKKQQGQTTWTNVTIGSTENMVDITGLSANTAYHYKAYAKVGDKLFEGIQKAFVTKSITKPTVTIAQASNVDTTFATLHASYTKGSEEILSKGFEYKKVSATQWTKVTDVLEDNNNISKVITGLDKYSNYVYKAFVETASGVVESAESTFKTKGSSGLKDVGRVVDMNLYPNPATTEFKLVVSGVSAETKVVITDIQGRIINTLSVKPNNNRIDQSINVEGYAKGVYNVRITCENYSKTQKLIVK